MSNPLHNAIFQDADKAREWLERLLWANGCACGYCGVLNESSPMVSRPGFYQCKACRKQFTVKVGTVFERSHIPLNQWLMGAFLICASKKGISAHQMHRMMGITYKSAWFMMHRLREALRTGKLPPLGGSGKQVEADETYIGGKEKNKHRNKRNPKNIGGMGKEVVFSLVERRGSVRSQHVPEVSGKTLAPILRAQLHPETILMTDEAGQYREVGAEFAGHETVNHGIGEYVRGGAHSNTVEGYFSILKRGIVGVYHHVSPQHLKRYLAEFDFRYNNRMGLGVNDVERTEKALMGIVGKRITYRRTDNVANA